MSIVGKIYLLESTNVYNKIESFIKYTLNLLLQNKGKLDLMWLICD